jgi:hypothetical protein
LIEVWLFGRLLATLASALSVVLLIVALTSVTYLAVTLLPAVQRLPDRAAERSARASRAFGIMTAVGILGAAVLGLRVGAAGSGGEIVPTLAVSVAVAAACGATVAFAALGGARAGLLLGGARARRRSAIGARRAEAAKQLAASRRRWAEGDDLRAESEEAEAAVARLRAGIAKLDATRSDVEARLAALGEEAAHGDVGRELRRARDEVATKLELGGKILGAAEAAAFRMACSEPLRRLLRRRPRDLAQGLAEGGPDAPAAAGQLEAAARAIGAFLGDVAEARRRLDALSGRRPAGAGDDEPWAAAARDLDAVEAAYRAVAERISVVQVRRAARAEMDAVASAAGEVSDRARASGIPASDLHALLDEVTRAESAILMATPGELDAQGLTDALGRSTAALGGNDGASLDELLRALREVA